MIPKLDEWPYTLVVDVSEPLINEDPYSYFSFQMPEYPVSVARFVESRIKPTTHPNVLDLFAGQGAMALELQKRGWEPGNMHCVDRSLPKIPPVPESNFHTFNLVNLATIIRTAGIRKQLESLDSFLPKKVADLRGKFDLVTAIQSEMHDDYTLFALGWYFLASGGVLVPDSHRLTPEVFGYNFFEQKTSHGLIYKK